MQGAEDDIRHAIALNPSDALAHRYLSTVLVATGRAEDAVASARRALQLDPLSPASGTTVGYRLYYAGHFDAALREFDRALEGAPDYASAWIGKAQAYRALGQADRARHAVAEAGPRAGGVGAATLVGAAACSAANARDGCVGVIARSGCNYRARAWTQRLGCSERRRAGSPRGRAVFRRRPIPRGRVRT